MQNEILAEITRHTPTKPVLSLYLDMSVNSDNKRTYQTFINKQRSRLHESVNDAHQRDAHQHDAHSRDAHQRAQDREALDALIERIETWLATEFDTQCKGAIVFAEVGGDWFHATSFPLAVQNRMELCDAPVLGPLRAALANERQFCIATVDREHLHLIAMYLGKVVAEKTIAPEIEHPAKHDVQAGGWAAKDLQKWKAEETRKSFRTFADEIEKFGAAYGTSAYILLGTDENVKHFKEFLSQQLCDRILHTGHMSAAAGTSEIVRGVIPILEDVQARETARAIDELLSRVRGDHLATAGWHDTLKELQEGKVDRLFIASSETKEGVQCTKCGFYLVRRDGDCPYCGGTLKDGIDLVESMVRMAAGQEVPLAFVAGDIMNGVNGVGALLKFR